MGGVGGGGWGGGRGREGWSERRREEIGGVRR